MKGLSVAALVAEGARLRPTRSPDPVTAATKASSPLAHRIQALESEIAELDELLGPLVTAAAPELLGCSVSVPTPPPHYWWLPATTLSGCARKRHGRIYAVSRRFRHPRARHATDSTVAAIARRTARCGASSWSASPTTQRPRPTSNACKRGEHEERGHSHLEALRRPRDLSKPASRLNPRQWVWLIP